MAQPLPSSLGVLPVGLGHGGDLVMPVDDHEAFWIGLDLAPGAMPITLSTTVELRSGEIRSCRLVRVTSVERIAGFSGVDGGMKAFVRSCNADSSRECVRLILRLGLAVGNFTVTRMSIRLLDYAQYIAESGKPAPVALDMNAGYRGWRLP